MAASFTASEFTVLNDSSVWLLDLEDPRPAWRVAPARGGVGPTPRAGMEVAVVQGRVLVLSGYFCIPLSATYQTACVHRQEGCFRDLCRKLRVVILFLSFAWTLSSIRIVAELANQTVDEIWMLQIDAGVSIWTQLRAVGPSTEYPQYSALYPYPHPYVAFGAAVGLDSTGNVYMYGGLRSPLSFFLNAIYNGPAGNYLIVFHIDWATGTFSWRAPALPNTTTWDSLVYSSPAGTVGLSLFSFKDILVSFGGFASFITECVSSLAASNFNVHDTNLTTMSASWTQVQAATQPPHLEQAAAVSIPLTSNTSMLVVLGGRVGAFHEAAPMWVSLSTTPQLWATVPVAGFYSAWPAERWGHTMVYVGAADLASNLSALVLYGGQLQQDGSGAVSASGELWLFEFDSLHYSSWTLVTAQSAAGPRFDHSAVVSGGVMFVFGGFADNAGAPYNDLWLFNVSDLKWTQLASGPLPPARGSHVSAYLSDLSALGIASPCIAVFGGVESPVPDTLPLADMWCFALNSNVTGGLWYNLSSPLGPPARQAAAGSTLNDNVWFINGGIYNRTVHNDTWVFAAPTGTWTQLPAQSDMSPTIFNHALLLSNDQLIILGGQAASGILETQIFSSTQFAYYAMLLACPPGYYSQSFADDFCTICPVGQYSDETAALACKLCPSSLSTPTPGATSAGQCTVCDPNACYSHGDCYIQANGAVGCHCAGVYQLDDQGMCQTPMLIIAVFSCVFGLVLIAGMTLAIVRCLSAQRTNRVRADEIEKLLKSWERDGTSFQFC